MFLVVGLGNPGQRYQNTWHNLGAMTVELLAKRWGVSFRQGRGECLTAEYTYRDIRTTLLQPTSYMNRSGIPVTGYMNYFHIEPENVVIIYDDHDLPLGKVRIRQDGTAGGHKGMDDIIRLSGTSKIPRIKIGIQTDRETGNLADQVLSPIPKASAERVARILQSTADSVEMILKDGFILTMERTNGITIE